MRKYGVRSVWKVKSRVSASSWGLPRPIRFLSRDEIFALPTPPGSGNWRFLPGTTTWLQTDSVEPRKCRWYLSRSMDDNPKYHIEVKPDAMSILEVLEHLSGKPWSNKAQLLRAMMPAIRSVLWDPELKKARSSKTTNRAAVAAGRRT
jgi:hypothetical protein